MSDMENHISCPKIIIGKSEIMNVTDYLKNNSLVTLEDQYHLIISRHDSLPLVILNYDQINSPKTDPLVMECRGLVVEEGTWDVIARPFGRFFNLGEAKNICDSFDWSDFSTMEKVDGTLAILYNYNGQWIVNTRRTFGEGQTVTGTTWKELFFIAADSNFEEFCQDLDPEYTYLFEICSPYNKIVRTYTSPQLYLLAVINKNNGEELNIKELVKLSSDKNIKFPNYFEFHSPDEIIEWLDENAKNDATFEGVVVKDRNNLRIKIKSKTYVALHQLKSNDNLFIPKNLVPIVLGAECEEVLTYFPEVSQLVYEIKDKLEGEFQKLLQIWKDNKDVPMDQQKEFALKIKDNMFSSILFSIRKEFGENQTEEHLRKSWEKSADLIVKKLF